MMLENNNTLFSSYSWFFRSFVHCSTSSFWFVCVACVYALKMIHPQIYINFDVNGCASECECQRSKAEDAEAFWMWKSKSLRLLLLLYLMLHHYTNNNINTLLSLSLAPMLHFIILCLCVVHFIAISFKNWPMSRLTQASERSSKSGRWKKLLKIHKSLKLFSSFSEYLRVVPFFAFAYSSHRGNCAITRAFDIHVFTCDKIF